MARLLIVDEDRSLCLVLEIAFRKMGHLVETVSSGQAAKKKIESQVYDLIIADIRMPDLTGIELLEYARETRNPAAFILITTIPTMSTAIQAVNLGAYRYLVQDRHAGGGTKLDGRTGAGGVGFARGKYSPPPRPSAGICRAKHCGAQPIHRIHFGNGPHRGADDQHRADYR